MKGILAVYRKELEDHFSSSRFIVFFTLILVVSLVIAYMVGSGLQEGIQGEKPTFVFLMLFTFGGNLFSLIYFIAIFGPLLAIVLGFDAINRERSSRTLSKLVSQPIYRDSIINGKFLAGVVTITIMLLAIILLISGFGLRLIGVVPGPEEIWRLAIYLLISIFYLSFWLGISILFSILFRSTATSAFVAIGCWIFFLLAPQMAGPVSDAISPIDQSGTYVTVDSLVRHEETLKTLSLFSPMTLYSEGTTTILDPLTSTNQPLKLLLMGPMERASRYENPLSLSQSLYIVFPHLISLVALTLVCFAISYAVFMRQEIRST